MVKFLFLIALLCFLLKQKHFHTDMDLHNLLFDPMWKLWTIWHVRRYWWENFHLPLCTGALEANSSWNSIYFPPSSLSMWCKFPPSKYMCVYIISRFVSSCSNNFDNYGVSVKVQKRLCIHQNWDCCKLQAIWETTNFNFTSWLCEDNVLSTHELVWVSIVGYWLITLILLMQLDNLIINS